MAQAPKSGHWGCWSALLLRALVVKPLDHAPSEREVTANFCAKGFKGLSYKNWVPPRKASQRCASISKNISCAITSNNPQEHQTYLLIYGWSSSFTVNTFPHRSSVPRDQVAMDLLLHRHHLKHQNHQVQDADDPRSWLLS